MGITLLIIAVVIEAALATYCVLTGSSHPRVRAYLRVCALAGFVGLALVSLIRWDLRWYGLTLLLGVWGALGTLTLIRGRASRKAFRRWRVVRAGVLALFLAFVGLTPALVFPEHGTVAITGEFQVATITSTFTDPSRIETYTSTGGPRRLSVEFWYPQDAHGTFPLIVFSHGGMATKSSNTSLYNELASHGYVVAAVDHAYQALFTTFADGETALIDPGYIKAFAAEDVHADPQQAYLLYQEWMKLRMGDLNFVIDTILARVAATDAEPVYGLVDPTRIGVMGHSLGGSAALGIGRERTDVSAVIALESPFMWDIQGTKDGEFTWNPDPYPTPVLNVYSDTTWSHLGELKQYTENAALLTPAPAAFSVHISGANHLSLTDLSMVSPFLTTVLSGSQATRDARDGLTIVNKVSLAFFDSYLKGTGSFTAAGTY